jgi:hypothetical protein
VFEDGRHIRSSQRDCDLVIEAAVGLFNFLRARPSSSARDAELTTFYATQPGWESYRSDEQILGFLHTHPHWKLVDEPVLIELTRRLTTPQFRSIAYNYVDGFFVLVMICEKYRVVETNFLKICREPKRPEFDTPAAILWMFAWTLQQLASRLLSEADTMYANREDERTTSRRFEDAKCAGEACLTLDPWFCTAYAVLPIPWVARAGDFPRAFAICDEGVRLCEYLQTNTSQLPCVLDQNMAEEASKGIGDIEAVRKRLAMMQG